MGYSATLLLPSIMLFPLIAIAADVLYRLAKRLGVTPDGVPWLVTYALIGCACYGALYLAATVDMMICYPSRLQKEYLGRAYGTPVSLRRFVQSGLQDPASEWRYRLSPSDVRLLAKRCKSFSSDGKTRRCELFSGSSERWFAFVTLEGNELYIIDGLH